MSQAPLFAPARFPPARWSRPGFLQVPRDAARAGGRQRPSRWDGEAPRVGRSVLPHPRSRQQLLSSSSPEAAARTSAAAVPSVSPASAPSLVLWRATTFIPPWGLAPASPAHPDPQGRSYHSLLLSSAGGALSSSGREETLPRTRASHSSK